MQFDRPLIVMMTWLTFLISSQQNPNLYTLHCMSECCRRPCHDNLVPPSTFKVVAPAKKRKTRQQQQKRTPFSPEIFTTILFFLDHIVIRDVICFAVKN